MAKYWCEWAWLPQGVTSGVLLEERGGKITNVTTVDKPVDVPILRGVTVPGQANAHSHAFHRALRGRTSAGRGTFWTWRDQMYTVAARLDPDSYCQLATAVYTEMVLAGITCVGEFHYLHHAPGGHAYDDPNAMNAALVQAASNAGIRLTLLDTLYLTGGFGTPLTGVQQRFSDGDAESWRTRIERFDALPDSVLLGAAMHSVRAVPVEAMPEVLGWMRETGAPLHLHLSEQRAENEACLAAHGCSPAELLDAHGVLGARTTAVHATHLSAGDVARLGGSGTGVCLCPTTEADLADGIGPAHSLAVTGSPLSLGSDGHSVIDPFTEARSVESYMRLHTETRGTFSPADLMTMGTVTGHSALGWQDAGWIGPGARADLVTLGRESQRLAGVPPETVPALATADDVRNVVIDGQQVVQDGVHCWATDAARTLDDVITKLF